jgi:methionyl-tRNA formyltransferase
MRVLYVSCAAKGLYGLQQLRGAKVDIRAVVTIPPSLAARHEVSGYADLRPVCAALGVPLVMLDSYSLKPEDVAHIEYDVVVVNGWNRLIPPAIFGRARYGGLGIHAGHPPIGHGRAPMVWNILLGRTDIEVYVFSLTAAADDGDVLAIQPMEITLHDDVGTLYEKIMLAAPSLFLSAMAKLARGEWGRPQALDFAKAYGKRTPADGLIDFSESEREVIDFIRAQAPPYPGAFSFLQGAKWTITKAQPFDRFAFRSLDRVPGRIVAASPSGLVVQTGGATVWLLAASCGSAEMIAGHWPTTQTLVGQRFGAT